MIKCTRCKWHKNELVNCVPFSGNPKAELAFLGEAFGKSEAKSYLKTNGKTGAFIGEAGKKLDLLFDMIKIKRSSVSLMNTMRCYQKGNPTPNKRDMDLCFPYTLADLQSINPKLVVALGRCAFYQATGKPIESFPHYRGRFIYSDKIGFNVFVTYHPASVLYDDAYKTRWNTLVKDFRNIPNLIDATPNEITHCDYTHITFVEQFREIYKDILGGCVYFDIETTGLDPYKDTITLLQINSEAKGIIYVIDGKILQHIEPELEEIFTNCPIKGQGYEFDVKFLAVKLGIFPTKWAHCTCLAEFIISGMKNNDLTYLTGKYVPKMFGYDDEVKKIGGAHKVKDQSKLRQYGADDVGVLPEIEKIQYKKLAKTDKQLSLLNNITIPCNKVLTKMSLRGIEYNIDYLWQVDEMYQKRGKRALLKIKDLPGIEECEIHFKRLFNPNSPEMRAWLLTEYYKLPILRKTKTKKPSVSKKEMKIYAEEHNNEYCKIMEKYGSIQTIRSNFLSGVVPKLVDGVAHTTYSLHSAATGRPASSNPNLQNISHEDEIRRILKARDRHVFINADYSQVEVRVAGVIYNDQNLIDVCNSTEIDDFHSIVTSKVYDIPLKEFYEEYKNGNKKYKDMRRSCKTITFGVLYQQSKEGLAYALGISVDEADKFIRDYFSGFPDLEKNIELAKQFIIKNGYIDTYFGFRRRWKNHSADDAATLREGVNHPIQGTAWNIMQLALIEVDDYLEDKKSALVMQTYDSLVVEATLDEVDILIPEIRRIMTTVHEPYEGLNKVNLKVDMEIGPNMADLNKI